MRSVGTHIDAMVAPSVEVNWLKERLPATPDTVVLIGAGTGHALGDLLRTDLRCRVVVLEPDPRAADALHTRYAAWIGSASARLAVLSGPEYTGGAEVATRFTGMSSAPVLVYPALERIHPREVARARNVVSRLTVETSTAEGARKASAGRYLLQTLANAPRLAREADISALSALMSGLPAVVVGAGPSLDQNIHDLAPVLDRVLVIACDTAARPLVALGVDPHFIIAADSSRAHAEHLSNLPACQSWLIAEGGLHPSAFTHFDHRTFYFRAGDHDPWAWLRSIGLDASRLDTCDSVAASAFAFAQHLGCTPVAFVGADFAFTDGRPYCRGTSFEPQWASGMADGASLADVWRTVLDRATVTTVPDLHGQPTPTSPQLVSLRDRLVDRVAVRRETRVVNATGRGLLFAPGIEQDGLSRVFAEAEPVDRSLVERVLRAAHQSAAGNLGRVLEGVTSLLAGASEDTFAQWMQAAAGTVAYPAIEGALRSPEHAAWMLAHRSLL